MKHLLKTMALFLCLLGFFGPAQSAERATKEEAVAMVKNAIAFYKANGKEKSFATFSDQSSQFRDRELFMIVLDSKGTVLAHTALKRMIGNNIMDLKDTSGVEIIRSFYKAVEKSNSGWSAEYVFINPSLQKMEPKLTYVEKFDDILFACGYHFTK